MNCWHGLTSIAPAGGFRSSIDLLGPRNVGVKVPLLPFLINCLCKPWKIFGVSLVGQPKRFLNSFLDFQWFCGTHVPLGLPYLAGTKGIETCFVARLFLCWKPPGCKTIPREPQAEVLDSTGQSFLSSTLLFGLWEVGKDQCGCLASWACGSADCHSLSQCVCALAKSLAKIPRTRRFHYA